MSQSEPVAPHKARAMMGKTAVALALALCGPVALVWAPPAAAQDSASADARVRKLEAEVKALQRQVFPGADPQYLAQGAPANGTMLAGPPAPPQAGQPATTAVTDLLTRVDALEAQFSRLVSQIEELSNRVRQLEAAKAAAQAAAQADPNAGGNAPQGNAPTVPVPVPANPAPVAAPKPAPAPKPTPAAKPSAERVAAVKAVLKPQTGDAGEDEYMYGFKLWEAKFYPEAAQQLKLYLGKYPHHKRLSYAGNLLGRALLDNGQTEEAAAQFVANYTASKKGERAGDSLLYLAQAMLQLKDVNKACIALAEFTDNFKGEAGGRLKGQYDAVRAQVKCN
jgi:TolA-binding protein